MERTKLGLSRDKMYKALGEGERTSKKVSTIRMSDGSTFKRKNANQYGAAEGGNDYTEKRSNRSDRFDLGGTADSSNTGANMGGTMGSSIMKTGGKLIGKQKNLDLNKNGKLDSEDFKMIRGKMKDGGKVGNDEKTIGTWLLNSPDGRKIIKKSKSANELKNNSIEYIKKGNIISSQYGNIDNKKINKNIDWEYIFKHTKYSYKFNNGGGLADVPESFPSNDAVSYKTGGVSDSDFEKDYKKVKNHIKNGVGTIDSGYVETTWENMSDITYSAIEDKLMRRLEKDGLFNYANGGSTKGFEYTIGGL
jgi:hypothetical protein